MVTNKEKLKKMEKKLKLAYEMGTRKEILRLQNKIADLDDALINTEFLDD